MSVPVESVPLLIEASALLVRAESTLAQARGQGKWPHFRSGSDRERNAVRDLRRAITRSQERIEELISEAGKTQRKAVQP